MLQHSILHLSCLYYTNVNFLWGGIQKNGAIILYVKCAQSTWPSWILIKMSRISVRFALIIVHLYVQLWLVYVGATDDTF